MSVGVWTVITVLIVANALYVAAEFGAVGARRSRIHRMSDDGSWLAFVSDVPGVLGADGAVQRTLTADEVGQLRADGVIEGGMIPKVDACLQAAAAGCRAVILDGRAEHTLTSLIDGETIGTVVGGRN